MPEALKLANSHLIPALKAFSLWPCEGDDVVLEAVREEWCQCLVHPLLNEGNIIGAAIAVPRPPLASNTSIGQTRLSVWCSRHVCCELGVVCEGLHISPLQLNRTSWQIC